MDNGEESVPLMCRKATSRIRKLDFMQICLRLLPMDGKLPDSEFTASSPSPSLDRLE